MKTIGKVKNQVTLSQVYSDDITNPFWISLKNNPGWNQFERDIDFIINSDKINVTQSNDSISQKDCD